jgi:hypothetical protein
MGKGGKRLQNTNHEIELMQHDLDDALHEIDRLHKQHKQDNSIRNNFLKNLLIAPENA